jgi:hypothetical protein
MARKLRVEYPGALYQVMSRGDHRETILRDDLDGKGFVETLGGARAKAGWQVHADWRRLLGEYRVSQDSVAGRRYFGEAMEARRLGESGPGQAFKALRREGGEGNLGERAKGDQGRSGAGGAAGAGDDDDAEVGGGAIGHGELEQRFEFAGRDAKESSKKVKVQRVRTEPFTEPSSLS